MRVVKVIEVVACTAKGINEAIQNVAAEVSRSVHHIDAALAKNIKMQVIDSQISSGAVVCRISFWIDGEKVEK